MILQTNRYTKGVYTVKVTLKKIKVRDLVKGYKNHLEEGVVGYDGRLDIRPPFQREFVYNETQQRAVINTIRKGFPLNVMYWAVRDDGTYEIIDGQQRTLSICRYMNGDFSHEGKYNYNLWEEELEEILEYELDIYLCEGSDKDKLDWFQTINIAGEKLTEQELRNAVYHGPWVSDAKRYFSKTGCPAFQIAQNYLTGSTIRQDYLETAIKWHGGKDINEYMGKHQHDKDARELWEYFESVITWVRTVFTEVRREMAGLPWGPLYNQYKDIVKSEDFDAMEVEAEIARLLSDEDVTSKKGVYQYYLTKDEKHLNIRAFNSRQRREAYEQQGGHCANCGEHFELTEMDADHITPWIEGGKTVQENLQMLCKSCNRRKSSK